MAAAPALFSSVEAAPGLCTQLDRVRTVQRDWADRTIDQRLAVLRRFRELLAEHSTSLVNTVDSRLPRSTGDTLSAEIIPLAEAARYLELDAARLLRPVVVSKRGRPFWLGGVRLLVQRDPHGIVLVIGPANYPIFLPGVQALQALVAGNAVVWKPGAGGRAAADSISALLLRAGLPQGLLTVMDESAEAGRHWIAAGVDKVVLTGSEASGRAVLELCAQRLIPATVELSGCDAMFVLEDADVVRASAALGFGLRLNGSSTCIAPRRVFIHRSVYSSFRTAIIAELYAIPAITVPPRTAALARDLVDDALEHGAEVLAGVVEENSGALRPVLLERVAPSMRLMQTDVFAPIAGVCVFDSEAEALALAEQCRYALGASVFGSSTRAKAFARQVRTGMVVVNDMIAPTADPRISFGGRGKSGFGKSRGPEGLLDMTVSKTIATQSARRLRHLEPPHMHAVVIFTGFLAIAHGRGWRNRLGAITQLTRRLRMKSEQQNS